ncbi:MAG: hypothetical protein JSW11_05270 [Candidatus Heimdallarchaeota archaeon]|nr:MAG: hypothetical protein JSW11_05270 [Candidatus Heimdallarchaeota archaeon]
MDTIKFSREYLLLGLRINKHLDGFVDSYYGPEELSSVIQQEEKKSPQNLLEGVNKLIKTLPEQGFDEKRQVFISKMLFAMRTTIEILSGEEFPYLEKVQRLFDIKPQKINDSLFIEAVEQLDELYGGKGSLIERIEAERKLKTISIENAETVMLKALSITREKTSTTFSELLPINERVEVKIVTNEPWSAYNWYLGKYKSRIDVNTDLPLEWDQILGFAAHEGYPGHHTEHSVKEKLLYADKNRFEHAILLILTPEAVISEGIANTGLDVIFPNEQRRMEIEIENFRPNPSNTTLEVLVKRVKCMNELFKLSGNLAIYAHVDGWTDDEIFDYCSRELNIPYTKERLHQWMKFIRNPLWAPYIFTYSYGEALIRRKFGEKPSPRDFSQLLTQPILPSDLE